MYEIFLSKKFMPGTKYDAANVPLYGTSKETHCVSFANGMLDFSECEMVQEAARKLDEERAREGKNNEFVR